MFKKTLFIGATKERCRDFAHEFEGSGFLETCILSEFINNVYTKSKESIKYREINEIEKIFILKIIIDNNKLQHFKFLQDGFFKYPDIISTLIKFFHLLKANKIDLKKNFNFDEFKRKELETLYTSFESKKGKQGLIDSVDKINITYNYLKEGYFLNEYEEIIYENYEPGNIHLWRNIREKEIYDLICKNSKLYQKNGKNNKPNIHFNEVFNRYNEIEEAAKIIKSILVSGDCKTEDIILTAPSLEHYAPYIEDIFYKYNLKVFITDGQPLYTYPAFSKVINVLKNNGEIKKAKNVVEGIFYRLDKITNDGVKDKITDNKISIKRIIEILNIVEKYKDSIEDVAAFIINNFKNEKITIRKPGILVQEFNQLIFREMKHVIIIGADSENMPVKSSSSFLYDNMDLEKLFYQNNSYIHSEFHVDEIFKNSKNIYIIKADYDDKTRLELSQIIIDRLLDYNGIMLTDSKFDGLKKYHIEKDIQYSVFTKEDILKSKRPKRIKLDKKSEDYIASLQSNDFTEYDGRLYNFDNLNEYYSVSQFNRYASCALNYFFTYVLKLEKPRSENTFEINTKGTFLHSCFEIFVNDVICGKFKMPEELNDKVKLHMMKSAKAAYKKLQEPNEKGIIELKEETIFHKLFFNEVTLGLNEETYRKGLLLKFLEYIYDENNGINYRLKHAKAVELKISENEFNIDEIRIKGFIDRVDESDDKVILIDYKPTRKADRQYENETFDKICKFNDFQLPVYTLFASQNISDKKEIQSYLLSFKTETGTELNKIIFRNNEIFIYKHNGKRGKASSFEEVQIPDFITDMKKKLKEIVGNIENGKFIFSDDEENCKWCDFKSMCKRSLLLHKIVKEYV